MRSYNQTDVAPITMTNIKNRTGIGIYICISVCTCMDLTPSIAANKKTIAAYSGSFRSASIGVRQGSPDLHLSNQR